MSIKQWHKFHMLNDCLEFHLMCVMSHLVQSRGGPCVCVCVCVWGGGGGGGGSDLIMRTH